MIPPKKPKKRPPARVKTLPANAAGDLAYCKDVTRQLTEKLEQFMRLPVPANEEEASMRQREHEWLFGHKQSLAATLALLAELMLKLEQALNERHETAAESTPRMSESDMALIESFITRAQGF